MGRIFKFLGMSVAVATDNMLNSERRVPFAADVTYVTAQVLCFTYLFDNTTQTKNYTVSPAFAAGVTYVTAQALCCMYMFDDATHTKKSEFFHLQQLGLVSQPECHASHIAYAFVRQHYTEQGL